MSAEILRLHLLRHADATHRDWTGPDAERPLTEKGRRQAERLGRHLASVGFTADAILSSPLVRARETAEIVASALGGEVRIEDRLASGVTPAAVEAIVADAGRPGRVVLVGHDPDFSELVQELTDARAPMKKGALARIDLPGPVAAGTGVLRWLLPPDLVPDA